jgi:hypothetical protein
MRETYVKKILELKLPQVDLAGLARTSEPRITQYKRGARLPADVIQRIETAIDAVERMHNFCHSPFRIETSDPKTFWESYEFLKEKGWLEKEKLDVAMDLLDALMTEKFSQMAR